MSLRWILAAPLVAVACSSVNPHVGARQDTCSGEATSGPATSSGTYGGSAVAVAAASATCEADAGDACDDCESQWCCDALQACYHDPVCFCADGALDECLDGAAGDAATVSSCWQ